MPRARSTQWGLASVFEKFTLVTQRLTDRGTTPCPYSVRRCVTSPSLCVPCVLAAALIICACVRSVCMSLVEVIKFRKRPHLQFVYHTLYWESGLQIIHLAMHGLWLHAREEVRKAPHLRDGQSERAACFRWGFTFHLIAVNLGCECVDTLYVLARTTEIL
jgi:hypothetical protein